MRVDSLSSLFAAACLTAFGAAAALAAPQPEISAAVGSVSEAEGLRIVTDLVAFQTRYSGTQGCADAADYLVAELSASGLQARLEPFPWGAVTLSNVSARLPGLVRPEDVVLVLAHYDSLSPTPDTFAPGADDNATGVACVLESARVLSNLRFEATIEFLLTGGEEQGLLGADFDAGQAVGAGERLVAVVNHDMVGYWPTGWGRDLDVSGEPVSGWLVDAYAQAAADYVPGMPVDVRRDWGVCGDDQVAYAVRGFPAIIVMDCYEPHMAMDGETTPHYHEVTDTVDTLDIPRMTQVARATAATLATLAVPIVRTLLRDDGLASRAWAGAVLRPGSPMGGALTRIDPAGATATARHNPASPAVFLGEGEPVGDGARGVVVFYETDRDETIAVTTTDVDSDGLMDVLVSF